MNARQERKLFATALGQLLRNKSKIIDDYRGLAEMLEDVPVALLLDWVTLEEEAHHALLIKIIEFLKQTTQEQNGNGSLQIVCNYG